MKENECELSQQAIIRDENWQQHAATCADCAEVARVGDWMASLAAKTAIQTLPTPGFLVVKARIHKKQAAAEKATRPLKWMTAFAGTILTVSIVMLFSSRSQITLSMVNAVSVVASFAVVILAGSLVAGIVCAAAIYLMNTNRYDRGTKRI